jgi:hypothetical protein
MGFLRFVQMTAEDAEQRLKRRLSGDPSRGEQGVLSALNARRIDDVRRALEHDGTLGADFKEMIAAHLAAAERRRETWRAWRVQVPIAVWDEYARESRAASRPIGECLSLAIQRDHDRRRQAADPIEALGREVGEYKATALQILEEVRSMRSESADARQVILALRRIEDALSRDQKTGTMRS